MSRVLQFKKSVAAASSAADEYKAALAYLMSYAVQVKAYVWPTNLNDPPSWYPAASETWTSMTGQLAGWAQSTLNDVIQQPIYLVNVGNQIIVPTLTDAINASAQLIQDPSSASWQNDLLSDLNLLSSKFGQFSSSTSEMVEDLESQASVFDTDATNMQAYAADALASVADDQQQILDWQAQVAKLQADIQSEAWTIAGASIATLAGIGMAVAAVGLAPASGGISLFLFVPAVLITTAGVLLITLNALEIVDQKDAIAVLTTEMTEEQADIAQLQTMATTLSSFSSQVDQLQSALSAVVAPWSEAETYFTEVLNELASLEEPSSDDWQQVNAELQEMATDWNTFMAAMAGITLDGDVNSAQLSIGMSSSEVQAALAAGTAQSIADYLAA